MSINRTLEGRPALMRVIRERLAEVKQVQSKDDERGSALVIANASVVLTGILMAVVLSSVVYSVGHTSASRAEAEARAAAEGGAQLLARYLMDKTVTDSFSCNT